MWGDAQFIVDPKCGVMGHSGGVEAVAFSSDGKRVVSGGLSDDRLIMWDVETGAQVSMHFVLCFAVAWCGVVWCGLLRCGVVWCGGVV